MLEHFYKNGKVELLKNLGNEILHFENVQMHINMFSL